MTCRECGLYHSGHKYDTFICCIIDDVDEGMVFDVDLDEQCRIEQLIVKRDSEINK
jgi:hypothetical protein